MTPRARMNPRMDCSHMLTNHRNLFAFLAAALFVLPGAPQAWAQDDDDGDESGLELPTDGALDTYWVLKFKPNALRMITPRTGVAKGRVYWYLLYTVENPSDEDREIYVSISASSDRKKEYGDLFLPSVERAIEKKEKAKLWGKTDEFKIISKRDPSDAQFHYVTLKAGEKRRSVAVFNRLDPNANDITIRVKGLSNEVRPATDADGVAVLEHRVRVLKYKRPGDEFAITRDSFKLTSENWVRQKLPVKKDD